MTTVNHLTDNVPARPDYLFLLFREFFTKWNAGEAVPKALGKMFSESCDFWGPYNTEASKSEGVLETIWDLRMGVRSKGYASWETPALEKLARLIDSVNFASIDPVELYLEQVLINDLSMWENPLQQISGRLSVADEQVLVDNDQNWWADALPDPIGPLLGVDEERTKFKLCPFDLDQQYFEWNPEYNPHGLRLRYLQLRAVKTTQTKKGQPEKTQLDKAQSDKAHSKKKNAKSTLIQNIRILDSVDYLVLNHHLDNNGIPKWERSGCLLAGGIGATGTINGIWFISQATVWNREELAKLGVPEQCYWGAVKIAGIAKLCDCHEEAFLGWTNGKEIFELVPVFHTEPRVSAA